MKRFFLGPSRSIFWAFSTRQAFLSPSKTPSLLISRLSTNGDGNGSDISRVDVPQPMENLYQEWTLDQDKLLWENRGRSAVELSSLLGRGLNGVQSRLKKLSNVKSNAYERLFSDGSSPIGSNPESNDDDASAEKKKLPPASEVMRRITYDIMLNEDDFSILHYDRVEDDVMESKITAPNSSIQGKARRLIDALPEHRIVGIKYKERIVWDRTKRIDQVFAGEGIYQIIEGYDSWKASVDAAVEWNRKRQAEVATRISTMLGPERYQTLKTLSADIQKGASDDDVVLNGSDIGRYVNSAIELFRQSGDDPQFPSDEGMQDDLSVMDTLSELVALLPDSTLRPAILEEISTRISRAKGKSAATAATPKSEALPELDENDLEESFVRGSGPGGQKINKTSNRVLLVHKPTGLRIECQDTRSLQQNRKIARKQLRLKLDQYINGSRSRLSVKSTMAVSKKQKRKSKNRARQRKKQEARDATDSGESGGS